MTDPINSTENSFFCNGGVKKRKNQVLKARLRTLILAKGMSEPDFFHSIDLTRQYWYTISWGLYPCPKDLKIKIAQKLGVDSSVIWRQTE